MTRFKRLLRSNRGVFSSANAKTTTLLAISALSLMWASALANENIVLSDSEKFPQPEVLKPNVEFWIKVYAINPSDQVLLHDMDHLDVIYEVIDFNDYFSNPDRVNNRTKWKKVDARRDKYKAILLSLANKINSERTLTADEERVKALLRPEMLTPKELRQAARNIRGQLGLKDRFLEGLKRSGMYREKIRQTFKEHGLPIELTYLPHVESEFNHKAYSKVGAAGLWQFTRSTGRLYMKINYDVDERFDPVKATESAAKLLKNNYRLLGSWPLAITAYNHGPNGMRRAKRRHGDNIGEIVQNYTSRSFGFASRNFYSEFLAAKHVVENYQKYFGNINLHEPVDYITFVTDKYYALNSILEAFKLEKEIFKELNPAIRNSVLSGQRRIPKNFYLHIPDRTNLDENALWASISPAEQFNDQLATEWYKVRRGDNLSNIARRLRTSITDLVVYNNLDNAHRIYVGQILRVPQKGEAVTSPEPEKPVLLADASAATEADTPARVSKPPIVIDAPAPKKADLVKAEIEEPVIFEPSNGLATPEAEAPPPGMLVELAPGGSGGFIYIPSDESPALIPEQNETLPVVAEAIVPVSEWIDVEPEETLGHYAEWLEVSAGKLREINNLAFGEEIRIGQKLHLSFEKVNPHEFQRRRLEFQQSIEEDFFAAWKIEGVREHTVKRGESIWYLTNRMYDLPLWLVAKYNPGKDLQDLHIGDKLNIPNVLERQ